MTDLRPYQNESNRFAQLSLKDLLDARDQYHIHLMRHPNVVATAVGRYRIRNDEPWPSERGATRQVTGERTLTNSQVRPYSWPAVLVFVERWEDPDAFSGKDGKYHPDEIVPRTLYLPDGRQIPVCVIVAPRREHTDIAAPPIRYPLNNIGGGYPVIADVQGQQHVATIACLVGDGHKVYALTNRHVTGDMGEVVYARLGGRQSRIGLSSGKQLTRMAFAEMYPGWPGRDTFVNLDVGLIDIDDLDLWTAKIRDIGIMEPMADLSVDNISLSLIGCHVRGYGAASGVMLGEIHALFYRYKSQGGFEYVSDLFIGPRSAANDHAKVPPSFATHPGDSGTLWLLEPMEAAPKSATKYLPLAMQWGQNTLGSRAGAGTQTYVLATFLSRVCSLLTVDPIRDWNLDQTDTWGAVGHFAIAARGEVALSGRFAKLTRLIENNRQIIGHDDNTILNDDFKGMGDAAFVPLADVPDFFWKHGKQGSSRGSEGPNHFADMDQPGPGGQTLLDLCKDPAGIDPDRWNAFYDQVTDMLTGDPVSAEHRGLLPFRVWEIFDAMVGYAKQGDGQRFLCAAGVLAHYVGDACQPLHISYLHDGDPEQPVTRTVHHRNGETEEVKDPLGKGVHSAYEDEMVNAFRQDILDGLESTPKAQSSEYVSNGFEAAQRTVALMRATFEAIPPADIVQAFVSFGKGKAGRAQSMWDKFGQGTIGVMRDGAHLLAVLWESAWSQGDGETHVHSTAALTQSAAMEICADATFVPSQTIDRIGVILERPQN
ncbi:MAG TPA: hypothetical protein VKQ27_17685 [Acetobacteraceae bacterium]|nr:hypothetical protein [Acetobacteraceae bacterium]